MYSNKFKRGGIKNLLVFCSFTTPVYAEVVTDGTVGNATSLQGPNYQVTQDLGTINGTNLFHSFQAFNLANGESATFSGDAGIQNVIARVTGGAESTINGTIGSTFPSADIYLVNPSGIVFGENASLNVNGSFYATTADYISLGNDGQFDATDVSQTSFSASTPSAFGFLDNAAAAISVTQSELTVPEGETLALVAGDIVIDGNDVSTITEDFNGTAVIATGPFNLYAPGGHVLLGAVAGSGEVLLDNATVDLSGFSEQGNINIINNAYITTKSEQAGTVYIRGGEIVVSDSVVDSATMGAQDHFGSGIDIVANSLSVIEGGAIQSSTYGLGSAGDINIRTDTLGITGNASTSSSIASRSFAEGASGEILIAADTVGLESSGIVNQVFGNGSAGNISIEANNININNIGTATFISSSAFGNGDAGNIQISSDTLNVTGKNNFTGIAVQVSSSSQGSANGGTLDIDVNQLNLENGGQISAGIFGGAGQGGEINIQANSIYIAGLDDNYFPSGVFVNTGNSNTMGNAGEINIVAESIVLENNGQINAVTSSQGNAGTINIDVANLEILDNGLVQTSSYWFGGAGDININADTIQIQNTNPAAINTGVFAVGGAASSFAGNIMINANSISLIDGGVISNSNFGAGAAGVIDITASQLIATGINELNNVSSGIFSKADVYAPFAAYAIGDGGSINIDANIIEISDGAAFSVDSISAGDGGQVVIDADKISVTNEAMITSSTSGTGNGGDIVISADHLSLDNQSSISASSSGDGLSGDIAISVVDVAMKNSSNISTAASISDGGDISVSAAVSMSLTDSAITTDVASGVGSGGNVSLKSGLIFLKHTNVRADAKGGSGGNIGIIADNLILSPDTTITASSSVGVDGTILIQSPNQDVTGDLQKMPQAFPDPEDLFRSPCSSGSQYSEFKVSKLSGKALVDPVTPRQETDVAYVESRCGGNS